MYYLADFARPKGAKDKQQRKRKLSKSQAELLAGGVGLGTWGGVENYLTGHDRIKTSLGLKPYTSASDKAYVHELAKRGLTKKSAMAMRLGVGIPVNAALGVGVVKLGQILRNKLRKNKDTK
jgi:hypothetical protein